MPPDVIIVNPLERPEWDEQVLAHRDATIFHTAAWTRVLYEAFGYTPFYFCRTEGTTISSCGPVMEIDSPLMGRRGKTLPLTDYCDVLADSREEVHALIDQVLEHGRARGWKTYELRGGGRLDRSVQAIACCFRHKILLEQDEAQLFRTFRSSTKRNIKRAIREGVEVRRHDGWEAMRTYYRLHCLTRKRQGLFAQPLALFRQLFKHIISPGRGFVSLATVNGHPVAGAIYFHCNREAVYVYGASDRRYQYARANNLIMWDTIQWCIAKGFKALDLGITDASNHGLLQYKEGMGAQSENHYYYKYDYAKNGFLSGATAPKPPVRVRICKRLPTIVLTAVGNLLYKHHG